MRCFALIIILFYSCATPPGGGGRPARDVSRGPIAAEALLAHAGYLAGDSLYGRRAGTPYELRWRTTAGCWGAKIASLSGARQILVSEFKSVGWVANQEAPWIWVESYKHYIPGHDTNDPMRPVMNITFVDGHVDFVELQRWPNNYVNSVYTFAPEYDY